MPSLKCFLSREPTTETNEQPLHVWPKRPFHSWPDWLSLGLRGCTRQAYSRLGGIPYDSDARLEVERADFGREANMFYKKIYRFDKKKMKCLYTELENGLSLGVK